MFNLFKLEFRETRDIYLGITGAIGVYLLLSWIGAILKIGETIQFFALMYLYLIFLVVAIWNFRNDLYLERAYLKFTLPVNMKDYLLAKVLNVMLWSGIIFIIFVLINKIGIFVAFQMDVILEINSIRELLVNKNNYILLGLNYLTWTLFILNLAYFCIAWIKIEEISERYSYFWIILFFIIKFLIDKFKAILSINSSSLSLLDLSGSTILNNTLEIINNQILFSKTAIVIDIVMSIILFILTLNLMDRKLDIL